MEYRLLDNDSLEIIDLNEPPDYSIIMYLFPKIDKIPINLEIYNIGALIGENGIIFSIITYSSFLVKTLNGSENIDIKEKEEKVDEYLSNLENNNYSYFYKRFKMSKRFLKSVKVSYDKLSKKFSKKTIKNAIVISLVGIGGFIISKVFAFVGGMIAFPNLAILGILFFYFTRKKRKTFRLFRKEKFREFHHNYRRY